MSLSSISRRISARAASLAGASLFVLGLLAAPLPVLAQENGEDADAKRLNVVTVTATRREESILDVPLAVTALGPDDLAKQGVADLRGLDNLSASFNINSTQTESQGTTLRIRGVGTTGNNIGLESSVGVFLDGVYLSRPGVALGDLVDVQQVEVLRGPQGTLFGRNTSAGALTITTKAPNLDEIEAFANATAGNFNAYNVQAGVSAPLSDTFAVRLSGAWRVRDGFIESTTGAESNDRNRWLLRGQALWQATPDLSLRIIADYAEADEKCCDAQILTDPLGTAGVYAAVGLPANGGVSVSGPSVLDSRRTNSEQFLNPFTQWGVSATVNWDLGPANLTYIAAYRDFVADTVQNTDFNTLRVITTGDTAVFPGAGSSFDAIVTQTHEARLQGKLFADRLDWLVGVYYSQEEIEEVAEIGLGTDYGRYVSALFVPVLGAPVVSGAFGGNLPAAFAGVDPAGSFARNLFTQDSESLSLFTHNVLEVNDTFDLTVGLRYVDETKDGAFRQLAANSPACTNVANGILSGSYTGLRGVLAPNVLAVTCFPFAVQADIPAAQFLPLPRTFKGTFEDDELVFTTKLGARLNPSLNAYIGFTRGFKSGGFNLDSTAAAGGADPRFLSEKVDAIEAGIKGTYAGGRGRFDVAFFDYDIEDFQVLEFTGVRFETFNVPRALSQGIEIELQQQVTDRLNVNGAVTYADSRYPSDCAPGGFNPVSPVNRLCGFRLTNAPLWVAIAGATWEDTLPNGYGYFANANVRYESDRRTSTQAVTDTGAPLFGDIQEANTKLNLRAGLSTPDGRWSLEVWGVNVTDEQTRNVTFNVPLRGPARGIFIQEPATYGATLRWKY